MSLMSPFELKMKLDLADDRAQFIKEHSLPGAMENVIVTDDGSMHFFDDEGNDITKSVESIGEDAFGHCESLTSIVIPSSVKSIDEWAFYGCESLESIVFKGKTFEEVKSMKNYPWGVEDESVFKAENKA